MLHINISLCDPKSSSHWKHSILDNHTGGAIYSQLAVPSRIRMRLVNEICELIPKCISHVNMDNTFPTFDSNLNNGNINDVEEEEGFKIEIGYVPLKVLQNQRGHYQRYR